MRFCAFLAISALWPCLATAQDWATRTHCDVEPRPVAASDFAPADLAQLEAEAAKVPNGLGRFWRIEAPGGAISHLWGTYHVSAPAILDLPEIVGDRIAEAEIVAVEIDYTFPDRDAYLMQHDNPGRYREAGDAFAMDDGLDLTYLGGKVEGWVYDRLNGYGTTEDALYVLTYQGLAELLLGDPCEDYNSGVIPAQDDFIQTLGRIGRADILSLETPDEFFSDLAADEATAKAIVAVYASYLEPPSGSAARAAAFQLYLEGRLGLLASWDAAFVASVLGPYGAEALERTDAYLIEFRNRRFLDRLAEPLASGGVFIAVGAAHLPGANGLVNLLEDVGHKLTRVPLPGEVQ
jgi:hypothetical protein